MWCCKKRQMLSSYKPCTQPTDEYRSHCIGNFANAKLFRLHSRALNLTSSFAAFGIKYSALNQSFAPPYFMKVNGMPYWRMLFANSASEPPASPLHMYMYASDYHIKDNPLPHQLRDVVKRCMLRSNDADLAKKLRNLANEHKCRRNQFALPTGAPPAHFDRICGLRSKKTAQGHRSCRRKFGGVDHRAHDGAVAAHHECEPLSIEPTALPLRTLAQSPGIQAPSDRNVALKTEGCVPVRECPPSLHRALRVDGPLTHRHPPLHSNMLPGAS
jgi:hypothetical protein